MGFLTVLPLGACDADSRDQDDGECGRQRFEVQDLVLQVEIPGHLHSPGQLCGGQDHLYRRDQEDPVVVGTEEQRWWDVRGLGLGQV